MDGARGRVMKETERSSLSATKGKEIPCSSTKISKKKRSCQSKGPMKAKALKSDKPVASEKPIKGASSKRKRTKMNDVYDDIEAKFSVMERASRVLSSLAAEIPTFVKCMLPSNVCYSFWMILPTSFCKSYMPSHDATIVLVDESGKEYNTTFLLDRHGLSAGWRGFSMSHRLLKGDILVFQLIEPCKFKVYIVRVNGVDVVDAALCLMNLLDDCGGTKDSGDLGKKDNRKRKRARKYADCFLLDVPETHQSLQEEDNHPDHVPVMEQSGVSGGGFDSEVLEGSDRNTVQKKEISCSESLFLHDHPIKGVACR